MRWYWKFLVVLGLLISSVNMGAIAYLTLTMQELVQAEWKQDQILGDIIELQGMMIEGMQMLGTAPLPPSDLVVPPPLLTPDVQV